LDLNNLSPIAALQLLSQWQADLAGCAAESAENKPR
jgi:hypothetical protein